MTDARSPDTRSRLLEAAAELISANPGKDVSLRAICEDAGVKMPTLYHFFGSKEGLLEAVVEHGFDEYLALKQARGSSGDPIQDIRDGWDAHVEFGLSRPGFYALMYGQIAPGSFSAEDDRPSRALRALMDRAEQQGRLIVSPEQAVAHVMAANIGVTLRQIVLDEADPELSAAVREATITAIAGAGAEMAAQDARSEAAGLLAALPEVPAGFSAAEAALLRQWLKAL